MSDRRIDFMVDSASRPDLLEQTLDSIARHVTFSGGVIRWVFHEAILNPALSERCLELARSFRFGFRAIATQENPQGEGVSITKMLMSCNSPYFIHWEDDFLALRDLDLAVPFDLMEQAQDVNQIAFNRRDTMHECAGWWKMEVERAGVKLTTSPHWRYTPAMWRFSWILPRWKCFTGPNHHWEMNALLQRDASKDKTPNWVVKNMGTYYLGPIGERAYTRHIGAGRSGRVPGS